MIDLWLVLGSLLLALALDLALGDPPNRYHPVAWMGGLIQALKPKAHATSIRTESCTGSAGVQHATLLQTWDWGAFLSGAAITCGGAALFALPLWLGLAWLARINWPLALVANVLGLKLMIAYHGLVRAAREVQAALAAGDLPKARHLLSWHLVSRDTRHLEPSLVAAATIESVAENLTDGLSAPLFYFLLGGLPAAWAYRFVNTCDSMLGYRDPQHEYLGKFPARFDDVLNWLPARLTGLALVAGAALAGADARRALATMLAQNRRTASPNAGWTMSAMAGALGVTLEKVGYYRLEGGAGVLDAATIERSLSVARATLFVLLVSFAAAVLLYLAWMTRHGALS